MSDDALFRIILLLLFTFLQATYGPERERLLYKQLRPPK